MFDVYSQVKCTDHTFTMWNMCKRNYFQSTTFFFLFSARCNVKSIEPALYIMLLFFEIFCYNKF